jgi:hypothetical protein
MPVSPQSSGCHSLIVSFQVHSTPGWAACAIINRGNSTGISHHQSHSYSFWPVAIQSQGRAPTLDCHPVASHLHFIPHDDESARLPGLISPACSDSGPDMCIDSMASRCLSTSTLHCTTLHHLRPSTQHTQQNIRSLAQMIVLTLPAQKGNTPAARPHAIMPPAPWFSCILVPRLGHFPLLLRECRPAALFAGYPPSSSRSPRLESPELTPRSYVLNLTSRLQYMAH